MLALNLFQWWYGRGWKLVLKQSEHRLASLGDMFSISIILRTMFAPWRRIISYPGAGLDAKLRAMGDNLVSRCVGFFVRLFVLLAAGVLFAVVVVFGLLQLLIWPLLPFLAIVAVVKGLI